MNIMVFDLPAVEGGALTILNDFYNEVLSHEDKEINWFFIVSKPELKEKDNVKVLRYPWVKKSWFHRLYFDHFISNRLIKQYKVDRILSFQNIVIGHTNIPQTLYLHQSLPFVEYKFRFKENIIFWIYQNIIGKMIKKSIIKAEKVVVQTEWMKKACIEQTRVNGKKMKVISPKVKIHIQKEFVPSKDNLRTFFFPAGPMIYKNHSIIIETCKMLKEKGIEDYKVIFTLEGDESKYIINLHKEVIDHSLPIEFIGSISRGEVFQLYSKSILIFPSYIETFGLPILESKLHKGIILASNSSFSKEILYGYGNAYFFDPFDVGELSKLMEDILLDKIKYKQIEKEFIDNKENSLMDFLEEIIEKGEN